MSQTCHLLIFLGIVVVGVHAQTTCQFRDLTLQVGQSVCNRTSQRVEACNPNGSLVEVDSECRRFFSPVCVLFTGNVSDGFDTTLVGVGQSVCLQGTIQRCKQLFRIVRRRITVYRWGRRLIRFIKRKIPIVNELRNSQISCGTDGCFVPYSTDQTILELNETRCVKGVLKTCGENFVLRKDGFCSCRFGHKKLILEGETVCDRRLGELSICVADGNVFRLEANGTCEVQCCFHHKCFSVNDTICSRGVRFTCRGNGKFQRTERCNCMFDGTARAPFSKWCYGGTHYFCNAYGDYQRIGFCPCRRGEKVVPVGSTFCQGRRKFRCITPRRYQPTYGVWVPYGRCGRRRGWPWK